MLRGRVLECILARHPGVARMVTPSCFEIREVQERRKELAAGYIEVETIALSVDPYMRCRMDGPGHPQLPEYVGCFELGNVLDGAGVGRVIRSESQVFKEGSLVVAPFAGYPWATVVTLPDNLPWLQTCPQHVESQPSLLLGALGIPGLTAYFGILQEAKVSSNDTVVVSGASGAVGCIASQIARNVAGAKRVIGICGSLEKCSRLGELGIEGFCYKAEDFQHQLQRAIPEGVDVYFDNVGGDVSEAVLRLTNDSARVPICGQIAKYNEDVSYMDLLSLSGVSLEAQEHIQKRNVSRGRYLVLDYEHRFDDALVHLSKLLEDGSIAAPETIYDGFTPGDSFCKMMSGDNFGKAVVANF